MSDEKQLFILLGCLGAFIVIGSLIDGWKRAEWAKRIRRAWRKRLAEAEADEERMDLW